MAINMPTVIDAVLRGAASANKNYEDWTSGTWLTDAGDEGLLVARIAEAVAKKQDSRESLVLQAPFEEIRHWSGAARPRGRPRMVLQGRRRADIALFDGRGRSIHVIEVKRFWQRGRCFRDIRRLRALLAACARHRDGSLKHGYLGFLIADWGPTRKEAQSAVEHRVALISDDVRNSFRIEEPTVQFHLGRMKRYPAEYGQEGEWMAAAFCMSFSH